jgi:hypothetical protein
MFDASAVLKHVYIDEMWGGRSYSKAWMRGSYCIQCIEVTSTGTRSGQIKVTV